MRKGNTKANTHRIAYDSLTPYIYDQSHPHILYSPGYLHLTLKGEAGAELVAGLVQLLGIKGAANAKGETAVDLGVVRERRNAEVVDLSLSSMLVPRISIRLVANITYLGEGHGVDLVLGSKLKTNGRALLGIPGSLSASLNSCVDLLVVRSSKDV
jgi:hypothetical protein